VLSSGCLRNPLWNSAAHTFLVVRTVWRLGRASSHGARGWRAGARGGGDGREHGGSRSRQDHVRVSSI